MPRPSQRPATAASVERQGLPTMTTAAESGKQRTVGSGGGGGAPRNGAHNGWTGGHTTVKVRPATAPPTAAVSVDRYSVMTVIGRGSFGKVVLVRDHKDKTYALKALRKDRCVEPRHQRRARTEQSVLKQIDHPFVARLYHTFQDGATLFFVLEFCPGGEMFFHLGKLKRFAEPMARFYAAEITLALQHIHELHIAYRDLKPENILLDANGHVQLVDFGLAKENIFRPDQGASSMCGTYEYLAPEVIKRVGHGFAVDWWNLGMVLFEMLTGLPPWYVKDRKKLFDRICNKPLQFPNSISQNATGLIMRLLNKNPVLRLGSARGAVEVQQQPFFSGVDWNLLLSKTARAPLVPCGSADRSVPGRATNTTNFDRRFTSLPVDDNVFINEKSDRVKTSPDLTKTDGDLPDGQAWDDWEWMAPACR